MENIRDLYFWGLGNKIRSEKLELVHTIVWGPTQVQYLGDSCYYVTFIDDATWKTWVYCIRHKSDVFDSFKKWKDLVEMRQEIFLNVSDMIMEVNISASSLIVTIYTMGFIERRQS